MSRLGGQLLVVALLGATALAFVATERLKLERSPITHTLVTKSFSPVSTLVLGRCHCVVRRARIQFRLRAAERVTISVLSQDKEVRRLLDAGERRAGLVRVRWNGRDSAGKLLPDGSYRVRVKLARSHRTILLPNVITLDRTPPRITALSVRPRVISPDGDQRADAARIRYRLDEPARVLVYADGRKQPVVKAKHFTQSGLLYWRGRLDGELRLGNHRLTFAAQDIVGNMSRPTDPTTVTVRFLQVRPQTQRVKVRTRFGLVVSTDRTNVTWKFMGRSGRVHGGRVVLRAPAKPGRRRLVIQAGPYRKTATIVVVRR